jgi:hypothetical protein
MLQSWRFSLPQCVPYEWFVPFQGTRQTHTEVHWTVQNFVEERWSSLSIGVAATIVRHAWRVSCLSTKKCLRVPEEQIPMEDLDAKMILLIKSSLSRFWRHLKELCKIRTSRCARCNGVIRPRKSYLGKRRRVEDRVFKFLFQSVQISGTRFILRGVGL